MMLFTKHLIKFEQGGGSMHKWLNAVCNYQNWNFFIPSKFQLVSTFSICSKFCVEIGFFAET